MWWRLRSWLSAWAIASPAWFGCQPAAPPRLHYAKLQSKAMGQLMDYGVFSPRHWDGKTPLPLVVFLHGGGDDYRSFDRHDATGPLDQWLATGKIPPFIMVTPDGGFGMWANWYDGSARYQDYVVDDLVEHIRARYPVRPGQANLHIFGISMGGAGVLSALSARPGVFGSAAVISAPIMTAPQLVEFFDGFWIRLVGRPERIFGPLRAERFAADTPYARIRSKEDLAATQLLIGAGRDESAQVRETTASFHRHLLERGVPHAYLEYQGGHKWRYWREIFPAMLCWQLNPDCQLPLNASYQLVESPASARR